MPSYIFALIIKLPTSSAGITCYLEYDGLGGYSAVNWIRFFDKISKIMLAEIAIKATILIFPAAL